MAQSLADAGAISQEEVATHPSRHVLTSALATRGAFVQVELKRSRLEDGDRLLLCSDGLTEMVPEETIARVLGLRRTSAQPPAAGSSISRWRPAARTTSRSSSERYRIP